MLPLPLLLLATSATATSYTLTSDYFNANEFQIQPYVSNGYIGQRIPVEGFGYKQMVPVNASADDGTSGWPLFDPRFTAAMVAGFYDQQVNTSGTNFAQIGGEQPISTLPTWSSLYLTVNGSTYQVGTPEFQISNWTQSMSLQNGLVVTSLMWTPPSSAASIGLNYTVFAHRTQPNLGVVRLDVNGLVPGSNVSFTDVLDGAGSWRTTPISEGILSPNMIHSAVSPNGISNVTAFEISLVEFHPSPPLASIPSAFANLSRNASTASQSYILNVPANGSLTAFKYVGIASSDAFPFYEYQTALAAVKNASANGYESILSSHVEAWNQIWLDGDIVIPNEPGSALEELQLATRASLFHLLSNVREGHEGHGLGENSIAPSGLTSDSYAGQIFWDADTFMFPSLLALHPKSAESITNFRSRQLGAAQENAKFYNRSGSMYPWTGARYGNCTGVGPCQDYELHLNNDISLSQYQYYASQQNRTWLEEKGWPIIQSVAQFWASQVLYNATRDSYYTLNETDPDEYANHVNNAAYTNAGISVVLNNAIEVAGILGFHTPANWTLIAQKIEILTAPSEIVLEYDGFNGTTSVKQSDVTLLTYPLEFNQSSSQALANLDYYTVATSPNGPAMTSSGFSVDASNLNPVGCSAWTWMLGGAQPYSRAPFYQFSEITTDNYATNGGTNPAFTFLTAHGGHLQTLTHGYTGYRSRTTAFYIDPILPPQLSNFTLIGMKYNGSVLDVALNSNTTTVYLRSGGPTRIEVGPNNAMVGNYMLLVGQYLNITTGHTNGTLVPGNLAQCATSLSNDTRFATVNSTSMIVPGQFSLSAIDGSNSTRWQPSTNATSSFTVDLGRIMTIKSLSFNWGSNPPRYFSVQAGQTQSSLTSFAPQQKVAISVPYNPATAQEVVPQIGNTTNFLALAPVLASPLKVANWVTGTLNRLAGLPSYTESSS